MPKLMICNEHKECPIDCEHKVKHEHNAECETQCEGSYCGDAICVEVDDDKWYKTRTTLGEVREDRHDIPTMGLTF